MAPLQFSSLFDDAIEASGIVLPESDSDDDDGFDDFTRNLKQEYKKPEHIVLLLGIHHLSLASAETIARFHKYCRGFNETRIGASRDIYMSMRKLELAYDPETRADALEPAACERNPHLRKWMVDLYDMTHEFDPFTRGKFVQIMHKTDLMSFVKDKMHLERVGRELSILPLPYGIPREVYELIESTLGHRGKVTPLEKILLARITLTPGPIINQYVDYWETNRKVWQIFDAIKATKHVHDACHEIEMYFRVAPTYPRAIASPIEHPSVYGEWESQKEARCAAFDAKVARKVEEILEN